RRFDGIHFFFEHSILKVDSINFWKRVIAYTLLMAVVGHLIENVYTGVGFLLGSFDVDDPNFIEIWLRPLKPMFVYSICTLFFFFIVIPIKEQINKHLRSKVLNIVAVFLAAFIIAFLTELIMGLLLNQPDEFGVYPLWDFTDYDFTVLNQAYLVNDISYAVLITVCAFFVMPPLEHRLSKLRPRTQSIFMICSAVFTGALFLFYLPTYIDPLSEYGLTGLLPA
ncbi:MAG: hypothetical protein LBP28_02170, partial [Coriobacteriales bacterium]|nr:hypothetical protein [Coriobacteriales bacterium]